MSYSTIRFAMLFGAITLPAVAAETLPQVPFSHKDWEIACDNTRTCRAAGYQTEEVVPNSSLLLTRQAGPHQPIVADLQLAASADDSAAPTALLMRTGNRTLGTGNRTLGTVRMGKQHSHGHLARGQTTALLNALRDNDPITWSAGSVGWGISKMGHMPCCSRWTSFREGWTPRVR